MIDRIDKEHCCGCLACKSICPQKAIGIYTDEKGFQYPTINNKLCIKCGLCEKVCDFISDKLNETEPDCYSVCASDNEEVISSRSGGFFSILAKYVIKKNGVVFGCELANKNEISHTYYGNIKDVNKFKGSKYVQSDLKNTYEECLDLLNNGKIVLFSGTACQVQGLISFLKLKNVDTTNLITCDLICHGTPSAKIWQEYLKEFERKNNFYINDVIFRNKKDFTWKDCITTFIDETGNKISTSSWFDMYYDHVLFRESCFNCKYSTIYRNSDFTIGDCWGVEKTDFKSMNINGTSLVIVRSDVGKRIFKELGEEIKSLRVNKDKIMQPSLMHPVNKGSRYDKFWKDFSINSNKCIDKYFFPSKRVLLMKRIKMKVRNVIFKK